MNIEFLLIFFERRGRIPPRQKVSTAIYRNERKKDHENETVSGDPVGSGNVPDNARRCSGHGRRTRGRRERRRDLRPLDR